MMKAVIYTRVSTKLQVDKYSLPAQEKVLKDCIAQKECLHFLAVRMKTWQVTNSKSRVRVLQRLRREENKEINAYLILCETAIS